MKNYDTDDIDRLLDCIADSNLKEAVVKYLTKYRESFKECPGSIGHHHKHTGGLLDHTVEVVDLAVAIGRLDTIGDQEDHDRIIDEDPDYILWDDKLIISALLHDVGKINQYTFNGNKWTYTMEKNESKNYDHALWVVSDFRKVTGENLPEDIREAILGHHGGWTTNGAKCDTLLASILHSADLISSRL